MEINMSPEIKKDGNFWDLFKAQLPSKQGKLFESEKARVKEKNEQDLKDNFDNSNDRFKVSADAELESLLEDNRKIFEEKEEKEVATKTIEPEVDVRITQKMVVIQKQIDLLEKELANNLTITADRALETLQQLSKLLSELAKLYASMVNQSSIQYR